MKNKTAYECGACGAQHSKWQGQCTDCAAWNTLTEIVITKRPQQFHGLNPASEIVDISLVQSRVIPRISTGYAELDRVWGGGVPRASVTLIGGDPGIGKSTLLLQALSLISNNLKSLYITGEESVEQVALRAQRLNISSSIRVLAEINLSTILSAINADEPAVVVVDSIQTIYTDIIQSSPGSVSQVRECASALTRIAKSKNIIIIMIGHVTKDGNLAGPKTLEHIVDTVLQFEGDSHSNFRIIRSTKNRFGAVNEMGLFAMTEIGLKEITNPSEFFLSSYKTESVGSVILVTQESTRPLLVEVQSLVDKSYVVPSKRLSVGIDSYRLSMIIAVLQRQLNMRLFDQDIFLNVIGGIRVTEPAADLAIALAIISSFKNKPILNNTVVFGEIGLSGNISAVHNGMMRIIEASRLGYNNIIAPTANINNQKLPDGNLIGVRDIKQAVQCCIN